MSDTLAIVILAALFGWFLIFDAWWKTGTEKRLSNLEKENTK